MLREFNITQRVLLLQDIMNALHYFAFTNSISICKEDERLKGM
jgi:hypothetical protein